MIVAEVLRGIGKFVVNLKKGTTYRITTIATNATNAQDGQVMVVYQSIDTNEHYVREINEFCEKFKFLE